MPRCVLADLCAVWKTQSLWQPLSPANAKCHAIEKSIIQGRRISMSIHAGSQMCVSSHMICVFICQWHSTETFLDCLLCSWKLRRVLFYWGVHLHWRAAWHVTAPAHQSLLSRAVSTVLLLQRGRQFHRVCSSVSSLCPERLHAGLYARWANRPPELFQHRHLVRTLLSYAQ